MQYCKPCALVTGALLLTALMLAPLVASGAEGDHTQGTDLEKITIPEPGESPTIDAVKNRGTLKVGETILAPWLLVNPSTGKYFGPAAVVAEQVAKALDVKLKYVDATWDTIIAGLIARKYDLAAAALFETPAREKVIGMVTYDNTSGTCYMVRPDSDIKSLSDLNNSKYVYLGYVGYATVPLFHKKYPKTKQALISPPPGSTSRVSDLLHGRGDIVPFDSPLAYWMQEKWGDQVRMIPSADQCFRHPDIPRAIGIGYPKGDAAFGKFLKEVIDASKKELVQAKKKYSQPDWIKKQQ